MPKLKTPPNPRLVAAVDRVISVSGGMVPLAKAIGTSRNAVWSWRHVLGYIPAERIGQVSTVTGIPPDELRPDLFDQGRHAVVAETDA